MNKEQLLAAAEVMRRAAEGEPVESRFKKTTNPLWIRSETPIFDWETFNYRIKPNLREVWVTDDGQHIRQYDPAYSHGWHDLTKWKKYREVVE